MICSWEKKITIVKGIIINKTKIGQTDKKTDRQSFSI